MSKIECSIVIEVGQYTNDFIEDLESMSISLASCSQEVFILTRSEDKLYEIPASTIEIIHQNNKYIVKHKGRLQKRDGAIQARSICISIAVDRPVSFFLACGYEINEQKKRDVTLGTSDTISLCWYEDQGLYVEASIVCQQSEVDDAIEKLKDLDKDIKKLLVID
ncbi:hypothetical protein SteCoe_19016 [Stentor coeruleus]|uniref:Uncharacterized protein n=1 Tax=Stentor coeruleus TaxID=5963 RepID=A0A1R2BV87_9CILI|nr:hypothetical protein SteCoe_19016 [Stentor coeruleus]